ncbi:hypothetical protein [Streptomyces stelliscabiei]|uniref:hypothetical protein n=1 Tax=Streptomyces stelliscabiei TaxID=146820 RepID=UPI0029A42508|nr:hypothetical protein [Streptomyces stelliscabiei]MDX2550190.1 hypothetical protein [Streptomyces stelliscabiei]
MSECLTTAERFAHDTANHQMVVRHEDGLYRHLRFANPAADGHTPFELITWPYNLVVKAGWVFHFDIDATPDMLDLFRKTAFPGEINPGYWSEKVRAGRDEIDGFSDELFEQQVKAHVVDAIREGDAPRGIGAAVTSEIFAWGDISHEAGARQALEDFRFQDWTFGETWEWNFRDYTPGFLHCCRAVRRGVELWDTARKAVAA